MSNSETTPTLAERGESTFNVVPREFCPNSQNPIRAPRLELPQVARLESMRNEAAIALGRQDFDAVTGLYQQIATTLTDPGRLHGPYEQYRLWLDYKAGFIQEFPDLRQGVVGMMLTGIKPAELCRSSSFTVYSGALQKLERAWSFTRTTYLSSQDKLRTSMYTLEQVHALLKTGYAETGEPPLPELFWQRLLKLTASESAAAGLSRAEHCELIPKLRDIIAYWCDTYNWEEINLPLPQLPLQPVVVISGRVATPAPQRRPNGELETAVERNVRAIATSAVLACKSVVSPHGRRSKPSRRQPEHWYGQ